MAIQIIANIVTSIEEARQRGHDVWDLFLLGFASGSTNLLLGEGAFPPLGKRGLPTVYGVAIGNRSHIDRCVLLWDPMTTFSTPNLDARSPTDFIRRLSVHHPLIFSQPGNDRPTFLSPSIGAVRVAGESNTFTQGLFDYFNEDSDTVNRPISYIPVGSSTPVVIPFSDEFTDNFAVNPILHLQFFLRPPSQVPYLRGPFKIEVTRNVPATGAERLLGVIPIFGRRFVRVIIIPTVGVGEVTTATVRLGGFYNGANFTPGQEFTLATGAIATNLPTTLTVTDPHADWLTVYANSSSGIGFVEVDVFATDD